MTVLVILIVMAVVGIVFGCICLICEWDKFIGPSLSIGVISFIVGILWAVLYPILSGMYSNSNSNSNSNTPTALDVHRGKTTLEITYRDGVAVDSVVVYKMK